jgi:hypothetical protein
LVLHWLDFFGNFLAAGLVLLIPGGSLLAWLLHTKDQKLDPLATLADAAALSIAIMTLLALWLYLAGIKAGDLGLKIFYASGGLLLVSGVARSWIAQHDWRQVVKGMWRWLLALALLVGLAAWRFYQARDLVLPSWVDSVHHTLVVRKIVEFGGLPPDLSPYFPAPFFYHYGFHLAAALFVYWSHLSPAAAVLWFGNVINAMVALSVYKTVVTFMSAGEPQEDSVASRWWKRPAAAGLLAALLTGIVLQMPGYYVTWGRYTLLSGLILLGPALATAWEFWRQPGKRGIGLGVRLALLVGGLCTTHYFALLLFAMLMIILGLIGLVQSLRSSDRRAALFALAAWTILGLFIASPWVWRVYIYSMAAVKVQIINPIGQSEAALQGSMNYLQYLIYLIGPRRNHILLGAAALGLAAALFRPGLRLFSAWALLMVLMSTPWSPRLGPFRPDHFAIVLFFPAAVLLGNLGVSAIDGLSRLIQPGSLERAWFRPVVFSLLLAILLVWGMRDTQKITNAATILVDRSDLAALDWIQAHVPQTARFYINSVHWQGNSYRGVDGGYWLMPYTGRSSLLPPVLYIDAPLDYVDQVNQWLERAGKLQGCSDDFWGLVKDAQLTHVYLHRGAGNLQPGALLNCPGISLLYQNDTVSVYSLQSDR